MAGPWLYVISAASGAEFQLQGESIPVTVDSYRNLVVSGRLVEDRYWGGKHGISRYRQDVKKGDELFIYTGDQNLGIIGYAKINGVEERSNGWCVLPEFDLDKCRALLEHPVPAAVVREWKSSLRPNLIDLAPFVEQLRPLLPW
jgi:hypothetical protein